MLVVQASAVVMIIVIKRAHDDSVRRDKPPGRFLCLAMHYLKYIFCLWHIDYNAMHEEHELHKPREDNFRDGIPMGSGIKYTKVNKYHTCSFILAMKQIVRSRLVTKCIPLYGSTM